MELELGGFSTIQADVCACTNCVGVHVFNSKHLMEVSISINVDVDMILLVSGTFHQQPVARVAIL